MKLLLKCNSILETKAFYKEFLYFDVSDTAENTCMVKNEDGSIIFSEGDNLGKHPGCSGTVYFYLSDVEAYYKAIKNKVILLWPLQHMSYGTQEFGIKEVNGYHLAFAQR